MKKIGDLRGAAIRLESKNPNDLVNPILNLKFNQKFKTSLAKAR